VEISIIVPAFNEAKRIRDCIQSVRAAVTANLRPGLETQLIVVDNNSRDSTAEIAAREGARVVFVRAQIRPLHETRMGADLLALR